MEPERPIEKVLRAWGEKRREEAEGLEIHPATRKLLQGEVARKYARSKASTGAPLLGWFRTLPRWAWGAASVATLGACVTLIALKLNSHEEQLGRLAQNEPSSAEPSSPVTADAISPTTAATSGALVAADKLDDVKLKTDRSGGRQDADLPASGGQKSLSEDESALSLRAERPMTESNKGEIAAASPPMEAKSVNAPRGFGGGGGVASTVTDPPVPPASAPAPVTPATQGGAIPGAYGLPSGNPVAAKDVRESAPGPSAPGAGGGVTQRMLSPAASSSTLAATKAEREPAMEPGLSNAQSGAALYRSTTATAVLSDSFSKAKELAQPSVTERFTQITVNGNRTRGVTEQVSAAPVLNSFRIEQHGNAVRVVDADGSEYLGEVQPLPVPSQARPGLVRRSVAVPSAAPASKKTQSNFSDLVSNTNMLPDSFAFRVVGTNKSLHQRVVFTGSLITQTNAARARLGADVNGVQSPTYWFDAAARRRISGKATIGAGPEQRIEAVRQP